MHYAWGILVNCYNYYVTNYCTRLSLVMDTLYSSSVLPLRLLESVVRCSLTVLYTSDMISRYCYAGLDYYSQTRHTRWMLLLFSDSSHLPDLIITLRHVIFAGHCYYSRIYSAGHGLYPTCGVRGAASKPLTVRCYNSRLLTHCFLAYGMC